MTNFSCSQYNKRSRECLVRLELLEIRCSWVAVCDDKRRQYPRSTNSVKLFTQQHTELGCFGRKFDAEGRHEILYGGWVCAGIRYLLSRPYVDKPKVTIYICFSMFLVTN